MPATIAHAAAVALAIATAACTKTERRKARPAGAPAGAPPAELAAPDVTLTARELYAELRPDRERAVRDAARARFAGKTVRVSGEVRTNGEAMGAWEVTLVAGEPRAKVHAHPAAAGAADIKALAPGARVTLQCVADGWEVGPQLKYCVVVK